MSIFSIENMISVSMKAIYCNGWRNIWQKPTLWFLQLYFLFKRFCMCVCVCEFGWLRFYRWRYESNHRKILLRLSDKKKPIERTSIKQESSSNTLRSSYSKWNDDWNGFFHILFIAKSRKTNSTFMCFLQFFFSFIAHICMWQLYTFNIHGNIKKSNVYYLSNLHF